MFVWFDSLSPINNLSVIKRQVFLGWTSTKLGLMFLLKDTTQWRRWDWNPWPLCLVSSTLPLSHCDPGRGVIFDPKDITWTNLVEVYKVMLHTKYLGSRFYGFRQEDVYMFSLYIILCKICVSKDGAIFGPRSIIFTSLVIVYQLMLHTKYQSYRLCGFRWEDFLKIVSWKSFLASVT